jgi:perosamine synthetase
MIQSNTMYGVKTMVGTAGLNLVDFINCQIETLMPNYQDVENAVKNYKGDKNKLVIMLSDIGGIINPDIEKIAKFLKQENILLLEDAAHSFGARLNKKFSGTFGDAGVYSYYATKAIFAGEGGVAVTNNDELGNYLQDFIVYDRFKQKMPIGSNIRLSELQALMIFSVVNYYKDIILNKNEIAEKYIETCKRNEIQFISQNQNLNIGNYYKFTIISPNNEIAKVYPNIKTTTSKVYDYALGKNKDIPLKHLCLPIWYNQDKSLIDKVLTELNR